MHRRTRRRDSSPRNLRTDAKEFLYAARPFRDDLVVAAECMFCWYWLADLCAAEGIEFVLGHALYMRAIHGGKAKNDKLDSEKIAVLLRGGMLPIAYVYPAEMRSTRDLLRRRMHLVRRRSEGIAHVVNTNSQYNLPLIERKLRYAANRHDVAEHFTDASARKNVEVDLAMLGHYDEQIQQVELYLEQNAKEAMMSIQMSQRTSWKSTPQACELEHRCRRRMFSGSGMSCPAPEK